MHVGIDFGTSNTAFSVLADGQTKLLQLEPEETSIPTAIFYEAGSRSFTIGHRAIDDYEAGEEGRLMRSIKSVLGTDLIEETTQLDGRRIPFQQVITDFLTRTIRQAEKLNGGELDTVIQGRPVSFNDDDPAKDKRAQAALESSLRAAGVQHIAFLPEPVAAARSVEFPTGREKLIFVVDIGGGTSDFSVIRISSDNSSFDVLASTGVYLGGNDFDRLLSFYDLTPHFGRLETLSENDLPVPAAPYVTLSDWKSHNRLYSITMRKEIDWLLKNSPKSEGLRAFDYLIRNFEAGTYAKKTEALKIALSDAAEAGFRYVAGNTVIETNVTQAGFRALIDDTVNAMDGAAAECLTLAGCSADQITDIVMVGGSTHIPAVETHFTSQFEHAVVSANDRFGAVAKGLARYGATL